MIFGVAVLGVKEELEVGHVEAVLAGVGSVERAGTGSEIPDPPKELRGRRAAGLPVLLKLESCESDIAACGISGLQEGFQ